MTLTKGGKVNNYLKMFLLTGVLAMVSFATSARDVERFVIRMGDAHYRGQQTIGIKRMLNQQYAHINFSNYDLKRVKLVAKSKHGGGDVELWVGNMNTFNERIPGNPQDFRNSAEWTYSKIVMQNPNYRNSAGRWQLQTRGNIKIKKIVVVAESRWVRPVPRPNPRPRPGPSPIPRPGPGRINYSEIGSFKADKFLHSYKTFYPNRGPSRAIKLSVERNSVEIVGVQVQYGNGETRNLYDLTGYVYKNDQRISFLNGSRNIRSIVVTATTPNLFADNRGIVHVSLGK